MKIQVCECNWVSCTTQTPPDINNSHYIVRQMKNRTKSIIPGKLSKIVPAMGLN